MTGLGRRAENDGYRFLALGAVSSTMDEAMARAAEGDPGRLWIVAERQTAGRGRHGRSWTSVSGNLYSSCLLIDPAPAARSPEIGFVAGLALFDAVEAGGALAHGRLALKWPNDLLLDGAKIAGILVEGRQLGRSGPLAVAVGIGVNLRAHPPDTPYPATDLAAAGIRVGRDEMAARLTDAFAARLAEWRAGEAFAAIRAAWSTRAAGIGGPIRVDVGGRRHEGRFTGIDAAGRLILSTPTGTIPIEAGDVFPIPVPVSAKELR